ncbi:MAG: SdiA-regulated family protein [Puia sp.]|nr:SdiA-regulated family protein [Puia sp.]
MRCPKRVWLFLPLILFLGCDGQKKQFASPQGYDLNKPETYPMPGVLHEISGIAFNKGNSDTLYAEQDEVGKLFHFKLGDKDPIVSRFGDKGDFEDLTLCRGTVVMLRSDGVLFSFPLAEASNREAGNVRKWAGLLPPGEYEGLSSTEETGQLVVLCKHCGDDKTSKRTSGYLFRLGAAGDIISSGHFELDVTQIEAIAGGGKIRFHPSALAQNPLSREWYILSSVNKLLVLTDENWTVKKVYPLNPVLFPQPEGIAFANNGDLYISNERNEAAYATILRFRRLQTAR